ncbi:unnamed protein product [Didymodactylos carnosus]|uniref:Uncharacterized protein n=1 Tax=Didymodactylos carnosus TaxID=1234261 RepID=A0A814TMK0_9BILA|nr:unnamed protein product [Didymodactylos carnosus]CAF1586810.1 unnamed protein product [Didymodactylos carnosus]CAF3925727.1 unnamed protein product [Didymodactylos carnosus]CAF4388536.1 unnamed protein product [Didymodactylos carnosus]
MIQSFLEDNHGLEKFVYPHQDHYDLNNKQVQHHSQSDPVIPVTVAAIPTPESTATTGKKSDTAISCSIKLSPKILLTLLSDPIQAIDIDNPQLKIIT